MRLAQCGSQAQWQYQVLHRVRRGKSVLEDSHANESISEYQALSVGAPV